MTLRGLWIRKQCKKNNLSKKDTWREFQHLSLSLAEFSLSCQLWQPGWFVSINISSMFFFAPGLFSQKLWNVGNYALFQGTHLGVFFSTIKSQGPEYSSLPMSFQYSSFSHACTWYILFRILSLVIIAPLKCVCTFFVDVHRFAYPFTRVFISL